MLSTREFKQFAGQVVLFLHITSLVDGEPYPNLLREKGGNGYPTVAFLDHTGRVLTHQPFERQNVPGFRDTLERLQEWRKLKTAADPQRARRLFLVEMGFGMLEHAEARAALARVEAELSDAERQRVAAQMVELEFLSILKTIEIGKQATLIRAGKQFAAMIDNDRIPQGEQKTTFWQGALTYAASRRDPDHFEKIMKRAKRELAGDFRLERYLKRVEAQLEVLRQARRRESGRREGGR